MFFDDLKVCHIEMTHSFNIDSVFRLLVQVVFTRHALVASERVSIWEHNRSLVAIDNDP